MYCACPVVGPECRCLLLTLLTAPNSASLLGLLVTFQLSNPWLNVPISSLAMPGLVALGLIASLWEGTAR